VFDNSHKINAGPAHRRQKEKVSPSDHAGQRIRARRNVKSARLGVALGTATGARTFLSAAAFDG
jgi:hypothetical protein